MKPAQPPASNRRARAPDKGSRHWWLQRASALALAPLTPWFVFAILNHIGDVHPAASAWIARPGVALALAAHPVLLFFHAQLRLQVTVEDYISSAAVRREILLGLYTVSLLSRHVADFSVLRNAF